VAPGIETATRVPASTAKPAVLVVLSSEKKQEWHWFELYTLQQDLERDLKHTADRFEFRDDIQFGT
jgi:hypothetical protein